MSTPTTVRLDAEHKDMLDKIQTNRGATSRQEVFEALIEEEHARQTVNVRALASFIGKRDRVALDKLRDL